MPRGPDLRWSCDTVREGLSAELDGEATPAQRAAAEAHLPACPDCRQWYDGAAAVTRLARTSPAVPGPDVTAAVLPAAPGRGRARVAGGLRVALAAIGIAQLALVVAQLATGGAVGGGHGGGHVGRESAAWGLGLAVGFLWVAARRSRPATLLPVLTAFVGYVVLLNINDLASGRVGLEHVATIHVTEVVGYLIVAALSWPSLNFHAPRPGPTPLRRVASGT